MGPKTGRIAIIGAGAAGYFSAIHAAQLTAGEVVLFEATTKPLAKLLISGGGRCNVTNYTLDPRELAANYPRGSRELLGPFSRFAVRETMQWFEDAGVALKVEGDKRVFPKSDRSESVASALREQARKNGVQFRPRSRVVSVSHSSEQKLFSLSLHHQESEDFTEVILCCGGSRGGFGLAASLGHTIVDPVPSLFTFEIEDPLFTDLAGVSFENASLRLSVGGKVYSRSGPLLITHWGLSGPAVIQLSALASRELFESKYKAALEISFLPDSEVGQITQTLLSARATDPKKQLSSAHLFDLPKRFWKRAVERAGISEQQQLANLSKAHTERLAQILTGYSVEVSGKGVFKEEFVTSGGVSLREITFKTMESKFVPGLFFAGEIIDVDGLTGGFNFQNAWTTGFLAGTSAASRK